MFGLLETNTVVRSVSVNGEEVTLPTGSTSRVASNTLTLRLGRHTCSVCIRNAPGHPGRNIYSCVVDGAAVQELNEVVGDGPEGDMDHFISSGDVGVEGVGVARDRYGNDFLKFQIVTHRYSKPAVSLASGAKKGVEGDRGLKLESATVWRRFTEVRELHLDISNSLKGSHLAANLVSPPGKCLNPLVDQMGSVFVEERRTNIQKYLRHLLEMPKVRSSVSLLEFLGVHPTTGVPRPWAEHPNPPPIVWEGATNIMKPKVIHTEGEATVLEIDKQGIEGPE